MAHRAVKLRYAACRIKSFNAEHLDDLVRGVALEHLTCDALDDEDQKARAHWMC